MTVVINPTGECPPCRSAGARPSTSVGRVRKGLTNPVASAIALP